MRSIAFVLAFLMTVPALAETQAVKQGRMRYSLATNGFAPARANLLMAGLANVYYYDTAVELLAASPSEGVIGWAKDTDALYVYTGSAWVAMGSASGFLGTNGGTVDNQTNNVWEFNENGEGLLLTFGSNLVTFASDTGAVFTFSPVVTFASNPTIGVSAAGVDYTLTFDGEDNSGTITFDEDADGFLFDNDVGVGGALTATAASAGAMTSAIPAFLLHEIRFCGNGHNGATASYMGPVPFAADATYAVGGAGCDALDDPTIGNVDDAPGIGTDMAMEVVGLVCSAKCTSTSPADDTVTFTLYDDTAAATGFDCVTSALGGDGVAAQCSDRFTTTHSIAAGSLLAIEIAGVDDVCNDAGDDFECLLYVTF